MYSLAINTAGSLTSFALFQNTTLLDGQFWPDQNNQAEKLMPAIDQTLKKNSIQYQQIKNIYVISGPGSFTGLRVGVTVSNTLANLVSAKLFPITTFQYHHANTTLPVLIFAGRGGVYYSQTSKKEAQLLTIQEAQNLNLKEVAGDITPDQIAHLNLKFHPLKNPLKALQKAIELSDLHPTLLVTPLYIKPPQITLSKKQFTI